MFAQLHTNHKTVEMPKAKHLATALHEGCNEIVSEASPLPALTTDSKAHFTHYQLLTRTSPEPHQNLKTVSANSRTFRGVTETHTAPPNYLGMRKLKAH